MSRKSRKLRRARRVRWHKCAAALRRYWFDVLVKEIADWEATQG